MAMVITVQVDRKGCSCPHCIEMCKTYSCLPTPEEAKKLINGGYGNHLMMDTRPAISHPDLQIKTIMPAMVGFERKLAPMEIGISPCVFLKEDRCALHNLNLKPLEGRFIRHDTPPEEERVFFNILKGMWNTESGSAVVKSWMDGYFLG
jgi:hypothetical protein